MSTPAIIGVSPRDRLNRGNIVHAIAARRLLPQGIDYNYVKPWTEEELEKIRSHSHLVVIMANAIRLGADDHPGSKVHQIIADNIERAKIPTIAMGLGSQAALGASAKQSIPTGTLRLIQVLSDHSNSIACRGAFTVDALRYHGIKNGEAVGCQSAFWHGERLPFDYERRPTLDKVAFNFSVIGQEADIIEWAIRSRFEVISQTEFWEESVAKGNEPPIEPRQQFFLQKCSISEKEYRQYCNEHVRWFDKLEDWFEFIRVCSISIGTRFHGNMAALISGTPALWFVHDQRTHELCELLSLPSITLDDATRDMRIERFSEIADFDEFKKNYRVNYNRFRSYVENSGLSLRH